MTSNSSRGLTSQVCVRLRVCRVDGHRDFEALVRQAQVADADSRLTGKKAVGKDSVRIA